MHFLVRSLEVTKAPSASRRHGEPGGAGAGGARIPHALSPGLPRVPARDDEGMLEEGGRREAHVRVPAVLPGGLFHIHGATVPAWGEPIATLPCTPTPGRNTGFTQRQTPGFSLTYWTFSGFFFFYVFKLVGAILTVHVVSTFPKKGFLLCFRCLPQQTPPTFITTVAPVFYPVTHQWTVTAVKNKTL